MTDAGVKVSRMNALMERCIQTCRAELLDRTLIWNQIHLLHALCEYEDFSNGHRPHRPWHKPPHASHYPHPSPNGRHPDEMGVGG
ncbi:hypothetical protein GCM10009574_080050 [Streptomyces asiaticus]